MPEQPNLREQVNHAYACADWLHGNWLPEKHRVTTDVSRTALNGETDKVVDYIHTLLDYGQQAASIGGLTQEQAQQYRQDAIQSLAKEFCFDFVSAKPRYPATANNKKKIEQAKTIKAALGKVLGVDASHELLLTASFGKILKRRSREELLAAANNPEDLRNRVCQGDLAKIGLTKNQTRVDKIFASTLKTEWQRREIGTHQEQMRHLTVEFTKNMVIPAAATAIYLIPGAIGLFFTNLIPSVELSQNPNPLLTSALKAVFAFGGGIGSVIMLNKDIFHIKPFTAGFTNEYFQALNQYVKSGKLPSTPSLNGQN